MNTEQGSKLLETHRILHEEFSSMQSISETLRKFYLGNTSQTFTSIDSTYNKYGSELSYSSRFLREIQQRITMQDLVFYICFYMFLATCAWLLLKRFGLTLIIEWVLNEFSTLLGWVIGVGKDL